MPTLTLPQFITRWQTATLTERAAAQSHFRDLCEVLGQSHPAALDQTGAFYTFEKRVAKTGGGEGYADVWYRDHFAWEYKGKHKNLTAAYQQLLQYREDLENPPLLVVCDLNRFEVHTNFTGAVKRTYALSRSLGRRAGRGRDAAVETQDPASLRKRTLTNLYNQRPTWLDLAHQTLDRAVLDAYGWPPTLGDDDILARLLALNLDRAARQHQRPGSRATTGGCPYGLAKSQTRQQAKG